MTEQNTMQWNHVESSDSKWCYEVEPSGHLWVMFGTYTDEKGKTFERQPLGSLTGGMFIAFRQMLNVLEGNETDIRADERDRIRRYIDALGHKDVAGDIEDMGK